MRLLTRPSVCSAFGILANLRFLVYATHDLGVITTRKVKIFTVNNLKKTFIMCAVMALALFFADVFSSKIGMDPINFTPYVVSAFLGLASVFLYLCAFPSQRKEKFLKFLIPGIILFAVSLITGLTNLWLINNTTFLVCFIIGGQELSKPDEKTL